MTTKEKPTFTPKEIEDFLWDVMKDIGIYKDEDELGMTLSEPENDLFVVWNDARDYSFYYPLNAKELSRHLIKISWWASKMEKEHKGEELTLKQKIKFLVSKKLTFVEIGNVLDMGAYDVESIFKGKKQEGTR